LAPGRLPEEPPLSTVPTQTQLTIDDLASALRAPGRKQFTEADRKLFASVIGLADFNKLKPPSAPFVLDLDSPSRGYVTFQNRDEALGFFGVLIEGRFSTSADAKGVELEDWVDCGKNILTASDHTQFFSETLYSPSGVLRFTLKVMSGEFTFEIANGSLGPIQKDYLSKFQGRILMPK
jgi:hypothetical protein